MEDALKALDWKPTPVQRMTIEPLREGFDRLVVAPTGSGKTMAAVLPLLDRSITQEWEGLSILYITPLRALNRDVDRRIHEIASKAGKKVGKLAGLGFLVKSNINVEGLIANCASMTLKNYGSDTVTIGDDITEGAGSKVPGKICFGVGSSTTCINPPVIKGDYGFGEGTIYPLKNIKINVKNI